MMENLTSEDFKKVAELFMSLGDKAALAGWELQEVRVSPYTGNLSVEVRFRQKTTEVSP